MGICVSVMPLRTGIGGYMCYCNASKDGYWWGYVLV